MGFRFRKRVGLFGGLVHLNLSRGGVSVSAGPNDANVNFDLSGRRKHPRATLGVLGTGLSYQTSLKGEQTQPELSQMQEAVRDVQAERADEFGDWAAKVLLRVGFFSLLMVIAIAVGRLL